MNEKPYWQVTDHGSHIYLKVGEEVVELTESEARDLADTLHTYALDLELRRLPNCL